MSALAQSHQAINLSQGFPDFACDPLLIQLVAQAMCQDYNQYAPMAGSMPLRAQIAALVETQQGKKYDDSKEITITCGATEALFCAIQALVHPGDEVIVLEPAYDAYVPAILLSGGIPVRIPLQFPDFRIDFQRLKDSLSEHTRLIIVNSPHNPSGAVLSSADLDELAALIRDTPVYLIGDEVYEYMVYDQGQHLSLAGHAELSERSLVISSFGKSLHTTGWKLGFCLAPAPLTALLRSVHQFVTFSISAPFQEGVARYLAQARQHLFTLADFYQQKRDLFLDLTAASRFEPLPCAGTYFQLMRYRAISNMPDTEFCQWITREHGVAAIPVSVFYGDHQDHQVVRFCFAKQSSTLEAAAARLCAI